MQSRMCQTVRPYYHVLHVLVNTVHQRVAMETRILRHFLLVHKNDPFARLVTGLKNDAEEHENDVPLVVVQLVKRETSLLPPRVLERKFEVARQVGLAPPPRHEPDRPVGLELNQCPDRRE